MTQPDPSTVKLVIVDGQQHFVDKNLPTAAIREVLARTLPFVATAAAHESTTTIDEQTYTTVEFRKVAGHKGAVDSLIARLSIVPPQRLNSDRRVLLRQLISGRLTIAAALDAGLADGLGDAAHGGGSATHAVEGLCQRLLSLDACAVDGAWVV